MSADVCPHPGPIIKSFSFCHWNLDSIMVGNKVKIPIIEAISSVHQFDITALSETYLNDTIPNIELHQILIYTIHANHVSVCLYLPDIYCVNIISNLIELFLLMSADVYPHPGPIMKSFSFCHWNLDSIMVENKVKIPIIEAISSVHKFDITALSETYLNDTIPNIEIEMEGYSGDIFRGDHSTNTKQGGICLHYCHVNTYMSVQFI